jgi:radical SAM superfamily enzyme YgiQ (UPF0313 family)
MKVLLIRHHDIGNINTRLPASLNKIQGLYPPLGLLYIAATLEKEGHQVQILDSQALNLTTQETKKEIRKAKPDIVGITAMTPTVKGAFEAARLSKEIYPDVPTVLGGVQLSLYSEATVSNQYVDFGINGEGEHVMIDLLKALNSGKDFSKITGLIYKENGKVKTNGFRIVEDLDSLPFPARHLVRTGDYSCVIAKDPMTTLMTSRGCPYRCGFCFKGPTDTKLRFRSPKNVVDEIEECINKYKVKEIMFYDDTFTADRKHAMGICDEIIKRGIKISWETPTRVNCIDEELLKKMEEAGCIRLRLGVESGNDEILKIMRKGTNKEMVKKAFTMLRKTKIESFAYFIIGYVHENEQTIRDTINFAKELNSDWVMFTIATPLPQTPLFDEAVKLGYMDKDYWLDFMTNPNPERLKFFVKDADQWAKKAYKEFYFRPQFVLKKLKKLRSMDTFKKYVNGFRGIALFEMK